MSPSSPRRVLITRPQRQAQSFGEAVRAAGFEPIYFPVVEIAPPADPAPLDQALQNLPDYDWLVLTSANGVQAVWRRLADLGIHALPASLKVAAIGPKTAAALQERGRQPDFVPTEYIAEAILPGLGDLRGLKVLLTRADLARAALPEAIRAGGGCADEVDAYSTLPARPHPASLEALRAGVDVLTFTSSSTVRNFIAVVRSAGLDPLALPGAPLVACIGPITAATAAEEGLPVDLVASEYTTEGLLQSILARLSP